MHVECEVDLYFLLVPFKKMKYLMNRESKLHTIFTIVCRDLQI